MKVMRKSIVLAVFALVLPALCMGQTMFPLVDADRVMYALNMMKHAIMVGSSDRFAFIADENFDAGGSRSGLEFARTTLDSVFQVAESRELVFTKAPENPFGAFWDFSIENIELSMTGDSCIVVCDLKLYAAPMINSEILSMSDTLLFRKPGNSWRLMKSTNLIDFLGQGVAK